MILRGCCLHETRNEILTYHKKNSVYITFHFRQNEMNFRFDSGPK